MFDPDWVIGPKKDWEVRADFDGMEPITLSKLRRLERCAGDFVANVAKAVSERRYRIVGCATFFDATSSSVAILNQVKRLRPDTITILGGANCEGEMARGIVGLSSKIDYIFSGESEVTFLRFVKAVLSGSRPRSRLICGEPCVDLDALPTPTFVEFFEQRTRFLPLSNMAAGQTEIPYETSRGCWWGQRHHCTFCGLSGETMRLRQKSPDRIIQDLQTLLAIHPTKKVTMTDSIMPYSYFKTLLPRLTGKFPGASVFYDQKADLSLPDVLALKRSGITTIEPGIESLSSRLLTLMKKGVQARQNLMLLRYARAVGLDLNWNILWGFPGDDAEMYEDTLAILPLLHHLQPPAAMVHLSIERFSPYYSKPTEFGLRNMKPLAGYYDYLPRGVDVRRAAYHFTARYTCGSHDHMEVIQTLWRQMARWRASWRRGDGAPTEDLMLFREGGSYILADSRTLRKQKRSYALNERQASALVTSRAYSANEFDLWAIREKLAVLADGSFVPLAVADPMTLLQLTGHRDHGPSRAPQGRERTSGQVPIN
jgi:ribosomal peptide maturation radical SAM protein 1